MARIQFSALLSAASGKIGDVVMSRWKGIAYARRRVIPSNPQSGDQCKQRHILKTALLLWQSVKAWAKAPWTLSATGYALSGYNRFMDDCMTLFVDQFTAGGVGEDPTWSAPAVTVLTPYNSAYAALIDPDGGTPATTAMAFTWTPRAGAAGANMVNGYSRLDDASAWVAQTPVAESTGTITFTGLTNDLQYEFALVPHNTTSGLMGQSSHALNTPAA